MGCDFSHSICQVETRRGIWLVVLVLASVLTIQYFELPYRSSSILSLLPYGKFYTNFTSNSPSPPSSSIQKLRFENWSREINLTNSEVGVISPVSSYIAPSPVVSHFPIAPVKEINTPSRENASDSIIISPSVSVGEEIISPSRLNSSFPLAPEVLPSQSLLPSVNTSTISSNSTSDHASFDEKQTNRNRNTTDHVINAGESDQVVSLSEMTDVLLKRRASSFSKNLLWPSPADQELRNARFMIEYGDTSTRNPGLYAPVYRNLTRFLRSYEMMEKKLKIYVYRDGRRPVFHNPRLKGIYASEGWFMKHMEASNKYLTRMPTKAHLFYLPFSSQLLVDYVYVKDSHSFDDINRFLKNYLDGIKTRYAFWNRTDGSDHFLVACHDWAPVETRKLMANAIRAMCNADVKEGFQLGKDVSLPETYVHSPEKPMWDIGGNPPSQRRILAFFAGQMHGYVRPILLKQWQNKDPDMKIFGRMKKGYQWHMKNSRYCVCAKGYEVNSPRVVEAILYGCVPVIISDNFVPPFFEILKWDSFAVFVREKDIPDLKRILVSIPEETYRAMQKSVEKVRLHFMWHSKSLKYDIFHMILHSAWYNRVFMVPPR